MKFLTHNHISNSHLTHNDQAKQGDVNTISNDMDNQAKHGDGGDRGGRGITSAHNGNVTNNPPSQFVPRQTGIPVQINQPQTNAFNMNVRNSNQQGFMNLRPSNNPNRGGGGLNFNGGMQRHR